MVYIPGRGRVRATMSGETYPACAGDL
jgi:hypothetical protein